MQASSFKQYLPNTNIFMYECKSSSAGLKKGLVPMYFVIFFNALSFLSLPVLQNKKIKKYCGIFCLANILLNQVLPTSANFNNCFRNP